MSGALSPTERLQRVFAGQAVDRSPVVCPGGMMNAAIVDIMNTTGHVLPAAHSDADLMAALARDVQQYTGFENIGIPFCMTVEAEVLGSAVDLGTLGCEPKIAREVFSSVREVVVKDHDKVLQAGRIGTVVQAGYQLSRQQDIPVIGNLTGPVSPAASLVEPMNFLKELRKDPRNAHRVMAYVSEHLSRYARLLLDNGVKIFSIADPTATGEILGPKMFAEYAVPYLNKVIAAIQAGGGLAILHICGDMKPVKHLLPSLRTSVISTDAIVNLPGLQAEYPQLTTMGNLSTYLLELGSSDTVAAQTERLVRDGINIIAPACGLSTSTSIANIQAMTGAVKQFA
jgi:[methyl-Co(III) methanol-specific corrinoid protein]:coenzyme M methyltransferase